MTPPRADVLDVLPCGVLSFRDDGRIVGANRALRALLGLDDDEDLAGRHVETLFTVGTRIFYQTHLFPLVKLHGRAEEIYLALRHRDGGEVGVLVNAVRVEEDGHGVVHAALMRVRERKKFEKELLAARRRAEEALKRNRRLLEEASAARAEAEEANRGKSAFLATVSHEVRTPINAILGYVDLLELPGTPEEHRRTYLERVRAGGQHLRAVIGDLLDMARIESGGLTVVVGEGELDDALEMAVSMVEPLAEERDLTVSVSCPKEVVRYRGDPDRVRQILINLLSNAAKFTPPGGRLTVECGRGGAPGGGGDAEAWRWARVCDTGVGIPPEETERIFEPFHQVGTPGEGTGLGLAISRRLARAMGGDLEVSSTPGEGSCFTLWLPAAADQGAACLVDDRGED